MITEGRLVGHIDQAGEGMCSVLCYYYWVITVGPVAAEGFLVFEEGDGAHASWSQGIEEVCRDVSAPYAVLRVALLVLTMTLCNACADHRLRRQRRSAQPPCGLARSQRRIRVSSASLFRVILRTFHQSVWKARYRILFKHC
jgi:hypothetical protein